MEQPDSYLTLRALAKYSGLSVRTLRNHLTNASSPLPHYRIGGKLLIRRSDFDEWAMRFRVNVPGNVDAILDDVLKGW
jgi:excisionase family DNA binding protein